jgi:hypothetical protein
VWIVLPAVQNDPAQLPVRMITDNIGEQFWRDRKIKVVTN